MNGRVIGGAPGWFRAVAVGAIVWMLLGVFSYLVQVGLVGDVGALSEVERTYADRTPIWVTTAYAIAVFGGLIGAIGLLLLRRWARGFLVLSLICVVIQNSWVLLQPEAREIYGPSALVLPIVVIAIAVALVWLAHTGVKRGWLR